MIGKRCRDSAASDDAERRLPDGRAAAAVQRGWHMRLSAGVACWATAVQLHRVAHIHRRYAPSPAPSFAPPLLVSLLSSSPHPPRSLLPSLFSACNVLPPSLTSRRRASFPAPRPRSHLQLAPPRSRPPSAQKTSSLLKRVRGRRALSPRGRLRRRPGPRATCPSPSAGGAADGLFYVSLLLVSVVTRRRILFHNLALLAGVVADVLGGLLCVSQQQGHGGVAADYVVVATPALLFLVQGESRRQKHPSFTLHSFTSFFFSSVAVVVDQKGAAAV